MLFARGFGSSPGYHHGVDPVGETDDGELGARSEQPSGAARGLPWRTARRVWRLRKRRWRRCARRSRRRRRCSRWPLSSGSSPRRRSSSRSRRQLTSRRGRMSTCRRFRSCSRCCARPTRRSARRRSPSSPSWSRPRTGLTARRWGMRSATGAASRRWRGCWRTRRRRSSSRRCSCSATSAPTRSTPTRRSPSARCCRPAPRGRCSAASTRRRRTR